jgi:hypothetical protein
VKQSEPNTLQRELARNQQTGPHPDADVLTAFTEDALPEREREQLIAHLAVCAECREVLSLAASAAPESVTDTALLLPRPMHPRLRTWLPWVAVAAGVVIVTLVLVLHERKQEFKASLENHLSLAAKATVQPPAQPDKHLQTAIVEAPKPVHNKPVPAPFAKATSSSQQAMDAALAPEYRQPSNGLETIPQNPSVTGVTAGALPAAATPPAQASPVAPARSAPAFAMSKALGLTETRSVNAVRPHWRINSSGQVERSIRDSSWQPVLLNEKSMMRVVAVFGNDVWVGGEALRLYHSSDNGTTWSLISLPDKMSGERAITHIGFQTQQAGSVEADDGSSWTTVDGGKTWK